MATPYRSIAVSNTAIAAVAAPTYVTHVIVGNLDTAQRFLHLYDVAQASVNVGTTTPDHSFIIPAGDGTDRGIFAMQFSNPIEFATALTIAATTTASGGTAPTNNLQVNIGYDG